jgi:hypothetical protein
VALKSSLVVQLACDGQNKRIATQLKEAEEASKPLSFPTMFFPALVRVSNNENRPQNCAERWKLPYMRHIKTGSHLVSLAFKAWYSSCGGMSDIEDG